MKPDKTTVYFIPGMAAGPEIFDHIQLPENQYTIEVLEWMIPEKEESLKEYALRMAKRVTEPNPILIGVSFGGIVAQEMDAFLNLKNLVIISSVKTRNELPKRMKLVGTTKAYKLIPTGAVLSADDLTTYAIGPKSKKKLAMYQKYLSVRDKDYLDWSIEKIVTWNRQEAVSGIVHIQGDKDPVFPIKHIEDCLVIPNGTHIMILNRAREISKLLLQIFDE